MKIHLKHNFLLWILLASFASGCNIPSSRLKLPFGGIAKQPDPAKVYAETYANQNKNLAEKIRNDSSFASSDYGNAASQSNRGGSRSARGGNSSSSCGHSH